MAEFGETEAGPSIEIVSGDQLEEAIRSTSGLALPEALPVLPLRDIVAYPGTLTPLAVGQERSMRLIDDVLSGDRALTLVASRDPDVEEPGPEQLQSVGVAGVVARMMKVPDGTIRILVQGTQRVEIGDYVQTEPYLVARVRELPDVVEEGKELEALTRNVQATFSQIIEEIPYLPEELQLAVANVEDPSALSHLIAGALRIPTSDKQELLEQVDVGARLRRLVEILAHELEVIQLGTKIQSQVQEGIDKGQREYYLREQLKAIQEELGEGDEQAAEVKELRERIEQAELPDYAAKAARISELTRDLSELLPESGAALKDRTRAAAGALVVFHPPCSLQHGQQVRGAVEALLVALGAEVLPFAEGHLCCGSAGTYSLLQPELAQQLRGRKLDALTAAGPEAILSANIGCIAHLGAVSKIPVRHWIEWIDERLAGS